MSYIVILMSFTAISPSIGSSSYPVSFWDAIGDSQTILEFLRSLHYACLNVMMSKKIIAGRGKLSKIIVDGR